MAEADGKLTVDLDPRLNISDLKKIGKELRDTLTSLSKTNPKGAPGLEKILVQITRNRDSIDGLLKALEKAENTKAPTEEYTELQSALANAKKQQEALNKKIQELEPKTKNARASVKELRTQLKEASEVKIPTTAYTTLQQELAKAEAQAAKAAEKMQQLQESGKDRSKGRGRPYTAEFKAAKLDDAEAQKQIAEITNSLRQLEQAGEAFTIGDPAKMETISTKLKEAQAHSRELGRELRGAKGESGELAEKISDTENKIDELKAAGKDVEIANPEKVGIFARQLNVAVQRGKQLAQAGEKASSPFTRLQNIASKGFKAIHSGAQKAEKAMDGIKKVGQSFSKVFKGIGNVAKNAFNSMKKGGDSTRKHLMKNIIQYGVGFRSLFFLARRLRATISDAFVGMAQDVPAFDKTMSGLYNTFNQLKASLATAIQPIVSALAPALELIMDKAVGAANAIGTFFATLTGQKAIYTAVKGTDSFAKSQDKSAKSAKKNKKAQKDLIKELGEYDKLSVIKKDKDSDSSNNNESPYNYTTTAVDPTSAISQFAAKLKAAWEKQDFAEIGKLVGDKINSIVKKIDDAIKWEKIGPKITKWVTNIGTAFNSLIHTVNWSNIGQTIGDGLNTVLNTFELILDSFDFAYLGTALSQVANTLINTIDWKKVGTVFYKGVNTITSTINNFVYKTDWSALGKNLGTSMLTFFKGIDGKAIGQTLAAPIKIINDTLNGFLTQFSEGGGFAMAGTTIGDVINGWFDSIDFEVMGQNITLLVDGIFETLKTAIETIKFEDIGAAFANILNGIINIDWGSVAGTLSSLVTGLLDTLITMFEKTNWTKLGQDIIKFFMGIDWPNVISKSINLILQLVIALINALAGMFEEFDFAAYAVMMIQTLITAFINIPWAKLASSLMKLAGALIGQILNYLIKAPIAVAAFITNFVNKIKDNFEKKKEEWKKQGKSVWDGVLEGILDALKGIGSWIKEKLWDPFIKGFKKAFGIASPSKKMKKMGGYLIDGLKNGLGNIWKKIKEAFDKALEKIKEWASNLWSNILGWFKGGKKKKGDMEAEVKNKTDESKVGKWWSNIKGWFNKKKDGDTDGGLTAEVENTTTEEKVGGWWTSIKGWFSNKKGDEELSADAEVNVQESTDSKLSTIKDDVKNLDSKTAEPKVKGTETKDSKLGSIIKSFFGLNKTIEPEVNIKEGPDSKLTELTGTVNALNNPIKAAVDIDEATGKGGKKKSEIIKENIDKLAKTTESKVKVTQTKGTDNKTGTQAIDKALTGLNKKKTRPTVDPKLATDSKGQSKLWLIEQRFKTLGKGVSVPVDVKSVAIKKSIKDQIAKELTMNASFSASGKSMTWQPKYAARGGILTKATPLIAGEDGPEAIVPLKNHTEWLDKVGNYVVSHLALKGIQIPKLATGSVIPPNREFLAMLGDQKQGVNVESPLSLIEQALENVFEKYMGQSQQPIYIQLNGRTIAEAVRAENNKRAKQFV